MGGPYPVASIWADSCCWNIGLDDSLGVYQSTEGWIKHGQPSWDCRINPYKLWCEDQSTKGQRVPGPFPVWFFWGLGWLVASGFIVLPRSKISRLPGPYRLYHQRWNSFQIFANCLGWSTWLAGKSAIICDDMWMRFYGKMVSKLGSFALPLPCLISTD